jgi:YD repeat-containing protein
MSETPKIAETEQTKDETDGLDILVEHLTAPEHSVPAAAAPETGARAEHDRSRDKEVYKKLAGALISEEYEAVEQVLARFAEEPDALQKVMELVSKDLRALRVNLTYKVEQRDVVTAEGATERCVVGCLFIENEDGIAQLFSTKKIVDSHKSALPTATKEEGAAAVAQLGTESAIQGIDVTSCADTQEELGTSKKAITSEAAVPGEPGNPQADRHSALQAEQPIHQPADEIKELLENLSQAVSSDRKITAYLNKGSVKDTMDDNGERTIVALDEAGKETFMARISPAGIVCSFRAGGGPTYASNDGGKTWIAGEQKHRFSIVVDNQNHLIQREEGAAVCITYFPNGIKLIENSANQSKFIETPDDFQIVEQISADGGKRITALDRIGRTSHCIWFAPDGSPILFRDRDGDWTTGDFGKTWINAKGMVREEAASLDECGNLVLSSVDGLRTWTRRPDGTEIYLNHTAGFQRITRADGSSVWEELTGSGSNRGLEITARTKNRKLLYTVKFDSTNRPVSYRDTDGHWTAKGKGTKWENEKGEVRDQRIFVDKWGCLIQISPDCSRCWITAPDGTVVHRNREAGYQNIITAHGASLFEDNIESGGRRLTAYDTARKQVYTLQYDGNDKLSCITHKNENWERISPQSWRRKSDGKEFQGDFYTDQEGSLVKSSDLERQVFTLDGYVVTEKIDNRTKVISQPDGSTVTIKQSEEGQEVVGRSARGFDTYEVNIGSDGRVVRTKDRQGLWERAGENSWKRVHDGKPWIGSIEIDNRGNYVEISANGTKKTAASGELIIEQAQTSKQKARKAPKRSSVRDGNYDRGGHDDKESGESEPIGYKKEERETESPAAEMLRHDEQPASGPRVIQYPNGLTIEYDAEGRLVTCFDKDGRKRTFSYEGPILVGCRDADTNGNIFQSSSFGSYKKIQVDPRNGDMIIVLDENSTCITKIDGSEAWLHKEQIDMYKRPDGACRWFHYLDGQLLGFDGYNGRNEECSIYDLADRANVSIDTDTGAVEYDDTEGARITHTIDGEIVRVPIPRSSTEQAADGVDSANSNEITSTDSCQDPSNQETNL